MSFSAAQGRSDETRRPARPIRCASGADAPPPEGDAVCPFASQPRRLPEAEMTAVPATRAGVPTSKHRRMFGGAPRSRVRAGPGHARRGQRLDPRRPFSRLRWRLLHGPEPRRPCFTRTTSRAGPPRAGQPRSDGWSADRYLRTTDRVLSARAVRQPKVPSKCPKRHSPSQ